jgi:hypothetical protein
LSGSLHDIRIYRSSENATVVHPSILVANARKELQEIKKKLAEQEAGRDRSKP